MSSVKPVSNLSKRAGVAKGASEGDSKEQENENSKPSLKPYGSNQQANEQAEKQGFEDAHDLKDAYAENNGAKFDIKYDTRTGEIYLESKDGKVQIPTGLIHIP